MGISGISPWSLILILVIVALIFGTRKLRSMGRDVGEAVSDFKQGLHGDKISLNEKVASANETMKAADDDDK